MLIINADDYGRDRVATDKILSCFAAGRITSASAMVFMADAERAAKQALEKGLETGLHLNFSQEFTGEVRSQQLQERHGRLRAFFAISRYASFLYNPLLRKDFGYVYRQQCDEYVRLYGSYPSHIDGHRHLHLCLNMLVDSPIARRSRVRRNFTFLRGEKDVLNRLVRRVLDHVLVRRYELTHYFFDISPISRERLSKIVSCTKHGSVELMVHPERAAEYSYLMSEDFWRSIQDIERANFSTLNQHKQNVRARPGLSV
jgi:predicted glycoside hydrolase/deacetylase ChbG (UPF0249 family)